MGYRLGQEMTGTVTANIHYLLDLNSSLPQVLGDEENLYLYGLGRIGEQAIGSGDWEYQHGDVLGSVRLLTDGTGQALRGTNYDPYGNVLDVSLASPGGESVFGFTGEQTDPTGNIYLRARYYRPETGQFNTIDPFAGIITFPGSLHPYEYGNNNPTRFTDPSGLCNLSIQECRVVLEKMKNLGEAYKLEVSAGTLAPVEAYARLAEHIETRFVGLESSLPINEQNPIDNTVWAMTILLNGVNPDFAGATPLRVFFDKDKDWLLGDNWLFFDYDQYFLRHQWLPYQLDIIDPAHQLSTEELESEIFVGQRGDWCPSFYDNTFNQAYHSWYPVATTFYNHESVANLANEVHDPYTKESEWGPDLSDMFFKQRHHPIDMFGLPRPLDYTLLPKIPVPIWSSLAHQTSYEDYILSKEGISLGHYLRDYSNSYALNRYDIWSPTYYGYNDESYPDEFALGTVVGQAIRNSFQDTGSKCSMCSLP